MKTGIMGTHGTGKTTLALCLAADLKKNHPGEKVGLLTEVARACPFPVNENATREAQLWIFHRQMTAEIEMTAQNEMLICDRTILDSLAYSQWAGFEDIVATYLPIALDWMDTYDEIFFMQSNNGLADDGFRSIEPEFQKGINLILKRWLKLYDLTYTSACTGEKTI